MDDPVPAAPTTAPLKIAVGIATVGRPEVVSRILGYLRAQERRPDRIVVCAPKSRDVAGIAGDDIVVLVGPHGLPCQRNAILDACSSCDVLIYFDDDFVPRSDYLAAVERIHGADPGVAMTTGTVVADGIIGPGLSFEAAEAVILTDRALPSREAIREVYNGYGCNMSVNLAMTRLHGIRFDEALPLYGWLEDVDFSRLIAVHGRILALEGARGVHLGIKSGRQSGVRIGYSQIANPFYLWRKGSFERRRALKQMLRNVIANLAKLPWPEAYIDRRGRVLGNLLAIGDLLRWRLSPARVRDL